MVRRGISVLFVVSLIVIAGCGGVPKSTPSEASPVTTSSNLPEDHPSINESSGNGETSEVNWTKMETLRQPTVLTLSHVSQLSDTGYHIEVSTRSVEGSSQFNQTSSRISNPRQNKLYAEIKTDNSSEYIFQNDSNVYLKSVNDSGATYETRTVNDSFSTIHRQAALVQSLSKILRSGTYRRISVERRGQDSKATYTLNDASLNATGNSSIAEASGEVILNSEGLVEYAAIGVKGTRNGTKIEQHIEYNVVKRGNVSVSDPTWIASAS